MKTRNLTYLYARLQCLCIRPEGRVPLTKPGLWVHGNRIKRLSNASVSTLTTASAGTQLSSKCSCTAVTFYPLLRRMWEQTMLKLYTGLIMSRLFYALSMVNIPPCSPGIYLETFHRAALRICLGVPSFSGNMAILCEAQDMPLRPRAESRALHHNER